MNILSEDQRSLGWAFEVAASGALKFNLPVTVLAKAHALFVTKNGVEPTLPTTKRWGQRWGQPKEAYAQELLGMGISEFHMATMNILKRRKENGEYYKQTEEALNDYAILWYLARDSSDGDSFGFSKIMQTYTSGMLKKFNNVEYFAEICRALKEYYEEESKIRDESLGDIPKKEYISKLSGVHIGPPRLRSKRVYKKYMENLKSGLSHKASALWANNLTSRSPQYAQLIEDGQLTEASALEWSIANYEANYALQWIEQGFTPKEADVMHKKGFVYPQEARVIADNSPQSWIEAW